MDNLIIFIYFLYYAFTSDPAVDGLRFSYPEHSGGQIVNIKSMNQQFLNLLQLNLSLSASVSQETVYVSFISSQPLYTGWTARKLCSKYANWDYWWLNTRFGIDHLDSLYVLVSLYNYSNPNYNFHRDILDYAGNLIHQDAEWNGYHQQPAFKDGTGKNIYIGHPVLGWNDNMDAGVVDRANYIYSSMADTDGNIYFTLLDSSGNYVYNRVPVFTGDTAQSWPGDSHLKIDSRGNVYICWSRNRHEIVYTKSTDRGLTWSEPLDVAYDFVNQVNKPEILVGPDDCIHFIWQHWTGAHNCLIYKKLNPDGTSCIDTTNLTPGLEPEVWAPEFTVDRDTNIHIVWSSSYQGSNALYYTLIDGKFDKNGQPAADSEITIIQEYPFYSSAELNRYPKVAIDSLCCANVIFEQGPYGSGGTKSVYYVKKTLIPQGIVIFPDSSRVVLTIDTVGGYSSYFLTAGPGRYYVRVWAWDQSGAVGWDTASIYISAVREMQCGSSKNTDLEIFPQPFTECVKIILPQVFKPHNILKIYDCRGRVVRTIIAEKQEGLKKMISWNGTDDSGRRLSRGCYFIKIDGHQKTYKLVKIK